jgi:L-threonylcarbamoyladenylate synthase
VAVIPTDTVYGLAASAFMAGARKKIFRLKGRSYRKPLILMTHNIDSLGALVEVPAKARALMDRYWPGPLTIILPTTDLGKLVMGGRGNVGVRIPREKVLLKLLMICGFPLATTSANPSKDKSAKTAKEAAGYFSGKVELIIDSGESALGKESTVLDMTHFPFTVVREGCLTKKELLEHSK